MSNVGDYRIIEALLKSTLTSLLNQTYPTVSIVVVCHQIPDWAERFAEDVHFLDISASRDLGLRAEGFIDRGAKFLLGSLYAAREFSPRLIMTADGDDLVHVQLADRLLSTKLPDSSFDGYLIKDGAEVMVNVSKDYRIRYEFAIRVSGFDEGCGTCRILDSDRLINKIRASYPKLKNSFDEWTPVGEANVEIVPLEVLETLWTETEPDHSNFGGLIHSLGRHRRQWPPFKLIELDFVAAAKVCGHGNHHGLNGGQPHWVREVGPFALDEFQTAFGLPDDSGIKFQKLALFRARMAHPFARRRWLRRSKPARIFATILRRIGLR